MFSRSLHALKNRMLGPWVGCAIVLAAVAAVPANSFAGGRYHGGGGHSHGGGGSWHGGGGGWHGGHSHGHDSHSNWAFSLGFAFGGPVYRSWNDGWYGSVGYSDGYYAPAYAPTYYAPAPVYVAPPPVVYYPAPAYYGSCYSTPRTYFYGHTRFHYGH